jgi:hypothetical protein
LTSEPASPVEALNAAMNALTGVAADKGLKLTKRIDPGVPDPILTDRIRLSQLVCWALTFMMRHAAEGELSVILKAAGEGHDIKLDLVNDGPGLAPQQLDAILTPAGELAHEIACFSTLTEALGGALRIEPAGRQGFALRITISVRQCGGGGGDGGDDRRRAPRTYQEMLQSNLGPVVDLSLAGMRVIAGKKLKGRVTVELPYGSDTITVRALVVWTNQIERRQFEAGLRFVDLRPEQAHQLLAIAESNGLTRAR